MINILKLRKLEKEKKSQDLSTEVVEEKVTEVVSLEKETSNLMPDIITEAKSEEEEITKDKIEISEKSEIPEKLNPVTVIDPAEQFRQSLIEQVLNDETMITRAELQKEIEVQEKTQPKEEKEEAKPVSEVKPTTEIKPVPEIKAVPAEQQTVKSSSYENKVEQKSKKAGDSIIQLVGFTIGKEYYGIDINRIKEINRMTEITKVPRAPHFIEGVINLRGTVIPVINLRTKVRMPKKEYDKDTRIIIVELSGKTIGFIVDGVKEVLRIPENLLDPPPTLAVGKRAEYIISVAKLENDLVILMDPEKILSNEETTAILKNK